MNASMIGRACGQLGLNNMAAQPTTARYDDIRIANTRCYWEVFSHGNKFQNDER